MKNILLFFLFTFHLSSCNAQTKILVQVVPIDDIEETPIYPRLTETIDGISQWKNQYKYIDSIEMNRIIYMSDGLKISGYLIKPKKPGNYPCIIFNRGGNREFGQLVVAHAATLLGELANQGYIVIASNLRGSQQSEGMEQFGGDDVNDVLNLLDVLKEVEGANTEKIGMYGWSRGGMMTYLALTKTDQIDVACVGAGNSDLTQIERPNMEAKVYAELIPNYANNKKEELEKRSAVYWADKFPKDVPILLLHGNSDWRVKSSRSLELALEFEKYRIPYRLKIFDGGDHGISEYRSEVNEEVYNWFNRYLKEDAPLPNMEMHGK